MSSIRWNCRYGHYKVDTPQLTYVVTKQWRRGEPMWFAYMHHRVQEEQLKEVPGPMPITRRQAMANCETHFKENDHEQEQ